MPIRYLYQLAFRAHEYEYGETPLNIFLPLVSAQSSELVLLAYFLVGAFDFKCQYMFDELVKYCNEWCSLFMRELADLYGRRMASHLGNYPWSGSLKGIYFGRWEEILLALVHFTLFYKVLLYLCRS